MENAKRKKVQAEQLDLISHVEEHELCPQSIQVSAGIASLIMEHR